MRALPSKTLRHRAQESGFTLLEVILAITLASGILVAMLSFYHQAAQLRDGLLQETERLSAIRLLLDKLTADLRSARVSAAFAQGLTGTETSLQLLRLDLPAAALWGKSAASVPITDLRQVSYGVSTRTNGTNTVIAGLLRHEQPFVQLKVTESRPVTHFTGEPEPLEPKPSPEALTNLIGFLYFRYWDGTQWVTSWKSLSLPQGVEVTLGCDPAAPGTTPEDYPFEMFRRVVYLPGYAATEGIVDESLLEDTGTPEDPMP